MEQARQAAHILQDMLKRDKDLCDHAGRLEFPYRFAGVLPHQPPTTIRWLGDAWGESSILGRDDLSHDCLQSKLRTLPAPFVCSMDERQVRAVCACLDARIKAVDHRTGVFKGVYDRVQEKVAKEPLKSAAETADAAPEQRQLELGAASYGVHRVERLEEDLPEEVRSLKASTSVRLVRGYAGTGKTDILILRACYLHETYPELDILVTTFNQPLYASRLEPELRALGPKVDVLKFESLCSDVFQRKHGRWVVPQDTGGLLAGLQNRHPEIAEFGPVFLAEEFIWMKETGRTTREKYSAEVRQGRKGILGRALPREVKERVFGLFELYQRELAELPAHDWVDLHDKVHDYLEEGIEPARRYDVILIDEAQHFAPTWMRIIEHFLKPGGSLFLCDDPSQSVFRFYSWRQKGVDVVGRTRWLRVPYRNTRPIFEAAYSLIKDNPLAQRLLGEGGAFDIPSVEQATLADGPKVKAVRVDSVASERRFIEDEITHLVRKAGLIPAEISILHNKGYVLDRYQGLTSLGVNVDIAKRQTGVEYRAVFIPQTKQLFERTVGLAWEEDQARMAIEFYVMMTRARRYLYILFQNRWPGILEPLETLVDFVGCPRDHPGSLEEAVEHKKA